MSKTKDGVEKICAFLFNFSNIDTFFIDRNSQIKLGYGYNVVPEPLKSYLGDISSLLELGQPNSEHNAFFHSTSYNLNFVTSEVYDGKEYIGNIVIGPYLVEEPTCLMIESVLFENKLSISLKHLIKQYYSSLPLISLYKANLMAEFLVYNLSNLNSFCFDNVNIGNVTYDVKTDLSYDANTIIQNKELCTASIEQRYIAENQLMYAVEKGDKSKIHKLSNVILASSNKIPDRIPHDPLRSRKNLAFVLNTLMRKAAEKGGLHPVKIHSISENFAIQIEKTTSFSQLIELEHTMTSTYCSSVSKYSLQNYNYLIRNVIEYIRLNLDQDLNLDAISSAMNLSSSELSRQFKKETGQAITEYINKLRINEAVYLLENENMSITDTAYMIGFSDVNYFTKVFKKIKGVTPSQYRNLNFKWLASHTVEAK